MTWDSAWVNPASLMVLCGSVVGQGLGLLVARRHAWRLRRLQAAYLTVSAVAAMMIWWILVFPASCHAVYRQAWSDVLVYLKVANFVPLTLLTKYNVQVCLSHQLPAVLWSGAVPLQLHPAWRGGHPQLHRLVGRVFFLLSVLMMFGVWLIDQQGLHFHINDFPTLRHHEASSFVFPAHVPRLEIMMVYFSVHRRVCGRAGQQEALRLPPHVGPAARGRRLLGAISQKCVACFGACKARLAGVELIDA